MSNRKESEIWQAAIDEFLKKNNVSKEILYDCSSKDYDKWCSPMEQAAAEAVLLYRKETIPSKPDFITKKEHLIKTDKKKEVLHDKP
jgi:hypothetical protein